MQPFSFDNFLQDWQRAFEIRFIFHLLVAANISNYNWNTQMIKAKLISGLLLIFSQQLIAQVTIIINELPENTPANDPIHIGGSFNGWQPGDENYQLEAIEGQFQIQLEVSSAFEYKFTRGDWNTVEGGPEGEEISNRTWNPSVDEDTVYVEIASWKDLAGNSNGEASTKAENVEIINSFEMPQLGRSRRIWIYLPPGYNSSTKSYPVVYMHDGQNLFDDATSFAGEWGIDETMNELAQAAGLELIIVGIDNGGSHRINEYAPWENSQYGGGEGEAYTRFLIETLKPYIMENYRVSTEPGQSGLIGSSMGGHISYYAGIKYPEEFSRIGALSPAFWINPEIYELQNSTGDFSHSRFYFMAGGRESSVIQEAVNNAADLMNLNGIDSPQYFAEIISDGSHSEWFWKREFSTVIKWLYSEYVVTSIYDQDQWWRLEGRQLSFEPYPSPSMVIVYDLIGKVHLKTTIYGRNTISLKELATGIYVVAVQRNGQYSVNKIRVQ